MMRNGAFVGLAAMSARKALFPGKNITVSMGRTLSKSTVLMVKHQSNFRNTDSNVESDEIVTDNNPWSPTLYNDIVYIKHPGTFKSTPMDDKYRLSYSPLYESPGAKYVSMLKRLSISFAVLGIYGAKLFYESAQFDDMYAVYTILATSAPALAIQYKTKDYITRIWRLYDKTQPQTLENLLSDEKLVMEKLNGWGSRTYNELLSITNNHDLKVVHDQNNVLRPYSTWQCGNRNFYVVDNIGGLKMDRLWGIAEHNSGINNGRYIEPQNQ
jgi:hypothetical protein